MAEAMLALQLSGGELINFNFMRNTAKIGADNLSVDVLSNRLNLLETDWKGFIERYLSLSPHREGLKQEKYFTHDLFSEHEAAYILSKSDLTTRLPSRWASFKLI